MGNLTVLVFFVTIFVIAQHGLAVRNFTTTGSIETQADDVEGIMNYPQQEKNRFPRSTHRVHRMHRNHRHKHAKITKFIVNGFPARKGQFPYQVAVHMKSDMSFCGNGAIVTAKHVLTVAWFICKARGEQAIAPQDLVVHAGMVRLYAGDLQSYDVQDTVCHEQNNSPYYYPHNIALIQITEQFKFSAAVKSIELSRSYYGPGISVTISGWGPTAENGALALSKHLQYGDTVTLSHEECRQWTRITEPLFLSAVTGCIHSIDHSGEPYPWFGDQGAPLVHHGELVGLVAWYYEYFGGSTVSGYVSVVHHLNWIRRQIEWIPVTQNVKNI